MTTPPLFFDILILKNRQTFFYMVFILCVLGGGSEQSSLGGEEFTRLEPVLLIVLSRPMGSCNFPGGIYVFATSSFLLKLYLEIEWFTN